MFCLKLFYSTPSGLILWLKQATTLIDLIDLLPLNIGKEHCRVCGDKLLSHLSSRLRKEARLISDAGLWFMAKLLSAVYMLIKNLLIDQVNFVLSADRTIWVESIEFYRWVVGQNFITRIFNNTVLLRVQSLIAPRGHIITHSSSGKVKLVHLLDSYFAVRDKDFARHSSLGWGPLRAWRQGESAFALLLTRLDIFFRRVCITVALV